MIKIALLVLTLGSDGGVSMALTESESSEDCAATAEVIKQVLEGAEVPIVTIRCGESTLDLTPFEHGWSIADEVNRYRVVLAGQSDFEVTPMTADESCANEPPLSYCARSGQAVIAP